MSLINVSVRALRRGTMAGKGTVAASGLLTQSGNQLVTESGNRLVLEGP